MDPSYSLKQFKDACKQGGAKVSVMEGAKETARKDFGLATKKDILSFIGYDGLVKPRFIRTKILKKKFNLKEHVMVDSYDFYSGYLYGYIAFMRTKEGWVIKSFKKNNEPDVRNFPFKNLDKKIH